MEAEAGFECLGAIAFVSSATLDLSFKDVESTVVDFFGLSTAEAVAFGLTERSRLGKNASISSSSSLSLSSSDMVINGSIMGGLSFDSGEFDDASVFVAR